MNATITGVVNRQPGHTDHITGYPISRSTSGYTIATVAVLTADGTVVDNVRVPAAVLDAVRVVDLAGMSDPVVWRIADRNQFGLGGRALAELARRELFDGKRWRASVAAGRQGGDPR